MSNPGKSSKRILLSGRFDPPHIGHWVTILRLLDKGDSVVVVVLDYPEKRYYARYAMQIFIDLAILSGLSERIEVCINHTHFAKITKKELDKYKCDLYAAGNFEVLNHIASLKMPCLYVDRAYDYDAHLYLPKWLKNKKTQNTGGKNMNSS